MGYMQLMQRVARRPRQRTPWSRAGPARLPQVLDRLGLCARALRRCPALPPRSSRLRLPGSSPRAAVGLRAIAPDGNVTVQVNRLDFGQGVQTGLPMILAEELDADWSKVERCRPRSGRPTSIPLFGMHLTGGSKSLKNSYPQYRELGARARAMLVAAAAAQWKVPATEIKAASGVVSGGGKSAGYGELAEAAWSCRCPRR